VRQDEGAGREASALRLKERARKMFGKGDWLVTNLKREKKGEEGLYTRKGSGEGPKWVTLRPGSRGDSVAQSPERKGGKRYIGPTVRQSYNKALFGRKKKTLPGRELLLEFS